MQLQSAIFLFQSDCAQLCINKIHKEIVYWVWCVRAPLKLIGTLTVSQALSPNISVQCLWGSVGTNPPTILVESLVSWWRLLQRRMCFAMKCSTNMRVTFGYAVHLSQAVNFGCSSLHKKQTASRVSSSQRHETRLPPAAISICCHYEAITYIQGWNWDL